MPDATSLQGAKPIHRVARIAGQAIGVISGVGAAVVWYMTIGMPAGSLPPSGGTFVVATMMSFLAVCAVLAALRAHGIALMVLAFASFFPVGLYLIGTAHWLRLAGIFDVGYLIAGILIWRVHRSIERSQSSTPQERGSRNPDSGPPSDVHRRT